MSWITAPDHAGRALPDVLPSLLGAMRTPGFTDTIGFPACRNAAVLLVDGLGWTLLREYSADAPFLNSLATGDPITVGFPTTTAASITSLGTGRGSGEHGVVGYSFAEPGGGLLHPLSWDTRVDSGQRHSLLEQWPPEEAQPRPTLLEQAADAGVRVRVAAPAEFRGTGLTRAALRGGEFRGVWAFGDLATEMLTAMADPEPSLSYGYHGQLDMLGHIHGPGSLPWRLQLTQIDGLIASLAERLPSSAVLAIVADHGMVGADPSGALDADADPALLDGVRLIGGESRARHVYARSGARDEVHAAWRDTVGEHGVVISGEEAIDNGWFGPVVADPVRSRIGDVVAVMRDVGVIRSVVEPKESALRGQHGSLTAEEQYVPLLVVGS